MEGPIKRRLAAILAADAVGYSSRMGEDEERTLRTLTGHRKVIDGLIAAHDGRIVATAGDGMLAEFGSSVEAVRCAVEIQEALATRNDSLPEPERLSFRIGVNLGDVIVDGADILGDGVNVAARLEGIAEPGGICVASSVFDQNLGKAESRIRRPGRAVAQEHRPTRPRVPVRTRQRSTVHEASRASLAAAFPRSDRRCGRDGGCGTTRRVRLGGMRGSKAPEPAPVAAQLATTPPSEDTRLRLQIAEAERAKSEAELARDSSQINLRGRPSADGTLVLQGRIVGSGRNRGREVLVRYEGRLIDGKGTLTGRQGLRSCSIALELM